MDAQQKFFRHLSYRWDKKSLLHDMMERLHLRKAAVYKRINGDTALTLNEAAELAQHFDTSLDTATSSPGFHTFRHPFMEVNSSLDFLRSFVEIMAPILQMEEEDSELTYLAHELPVFHYLSYDYIFQFLMAVWNHLHWSQGDLVIHRDERLDRSLLELRTQIVDHYYARPTVEIWNSTMLTNLFQKILFAINIRAFRDQSFVEHLIRDLERLVRDLKALAYRERDNGQATRSNVRLYLNEFGNYHNMVLFEAGRMCATGIGYDMPQFMISHDRKLFDYSKNWVEKIKRRSINITDGGFRHRELFFDQLEDDLRVFKEKAEKGMGG